MLHLQRPNDGIVPSALHQPEMRIRTENDPEALSGSHPDTLRLTRATASMAQVLMDMLSP